MVPSPLELVNRIATSEARDAKRTSSLRVTRLRAGALQPVRRSPPPKALARRRKPLEGGCAGASRFYSPPLLARKQFAMHPLQAFPLHVRIDLCRGDAGMSQHRLDRSKVRPMLQ